MPDPPNVLMSNVPVTLTTYTGTGAVAGSEVFVVPPASTRGMERFTTVQISFSADPGAYVFNLLGSLDGTNFGILETTAISKTTVIAVATIRTNVLFIRLDQVSKANAVTATALLMVA